MRYAAECQRPVIGGLERQNVRCRERRVSESEGASLATPAMSLCKASSAAWCVVAQLPENTDTSASTECRHRCRVSAGTLPAWCYKSGDLFVDELNQPGAMYTEVVEYDFACRINQD